LKEFSEQLRAKARQLRDEADGAEAMAREIQRHIESKTDRKRAAS